MIWFAWALLLAPVALALYTYALYPLLLRALGGRTKGDAAPPPEEWPSISISVPVFNEALQVRGLIESLLRLDYPAEKRQILVISDASSDGTDEIVAEYADRGVELLRMPRRGGKTAAENAAALRLRGEIVVNTDASIRIRPDALRPLIAQFADPTVGVASGRDVSVARADGDANAGESGYVGYEMWVRSLETRVAGIVGASGCFYAIRSHLHRVPLPDFLSRDFASALIAREHGYRAVSVDEAVCFVPRTASLRREYRRKVRTIARGMETLHHKRHLLNPVRYGYFAWMLLSHKVCRWALPWTALGAVAGLAILAASAAWAGGVLAGVAAGAGLAALGWLRSERGALPRLLALPAFLAAGNLAAVHAALRMLRGDRNPLWEPTRRDVIAAG